MRRNSIVIAAALVLGLVGAAHAAESEARLEHQQWSFDGPFGTFDQAQLQRGYKIYNEVCSQCHSMNLMSFRNLGEKGGPFWSEEYQKPNDNPYVKAIAADHQIADLDTDTGDAIKRPGTTADRFPAPFPNEYAARGSNGGALPPDLSVIVKAREGGADYVYSLMTGFTPAPNGLTVPNGMNYNTAFHGDVSGQWSGDADHVPEGGFLAMKPPLTPDKVSFDDGTASTVEQEAKDVAAFLAWASDPKQTERKETGFWVMIYLLVLASLVYASYRRVWRGQSH